MRVAYIFCTVLVEASQIYKTKIEWQKKKHCTILSDLLVRAVEPEPKNFRWWIQSLKPEFWFNRHSLLGELQIIQWFLVFN